MGIYDRDYQRPQPPGNLAGRMLGRTPPWSVNTWVIGSNVIIHILAMTIFSRPHPSGVPNATWSLLHEYGHFSTATGMFYQQGNQLHLSLEVWRLVTFQFLHSPDNIWHLVLNMFGLWVFGPIVEEALGRRKYLAFYLVCGIAGGVMYMLLNLLGLMRIPLPGVLDISPFTPLVGASAGVFGVIMACAYIAPKSEVMIFGLIPVQMKWIAYGYVGLSVFNLLTSGSNAGGDAAHIGGAIAGFFFIRNSHHLMDFFDILGDSRPPKPGRPDRRGKSAGYRKAKGDVDDKIDRILEKVSREGIQSLTDRDRKLLDKSRGDKREDKRGDAAR
jgi:membrane associated rhomboid family serine protease